MTRRPANVLTLREILPTAQERGYAVGGFAPRLTPLISAVLCAGERLRSPLIVQISQRELTRASITPQEFADEFFARIQADAITVPVVLHLDHTKELSIIHDAIEAGFTSVMMDASEKPFDENVAVTRRVVEYAHARDVSVEAELGQIGTTDFVETAEDVEGYTDPREAEQFVNETGVDALAVSVGTAHGLYTVRKAKVDTERLREIRARTSVPLVLHGGSDVPVEMIHSAIQLPSGGVSKINIATDVEMAMLRALGRETRLTNAECKALSATELKAARDAVEQLVADKITHFLLSAERAAYSV